MPDFGGSIVVNLMIIRQLDDSAARDEKEKRWAAKGNNGEID